MAKGSSLELGQTYQGVVTEFDEHIGLGQITIDSNEMVPFHCVNIADGTRNIPLGASVSFIAHWHPRGRTEAVDIINLADQ